MALPAISRTVEVQISAHSQMVWLVFKLRCSSCNHLSLAVLVLDKNCTEKVTEAGTVRPFCGDEEISVEKVLNVFFPYRNDTQYQ